MNRQFLLAIATFVLASTSLWLGWRWRNAETELSQARSDFASAESQIGECNESLIQLKLELKESAKVLENSLARIQNLEAQRASFESELEEKQLEITRLKTENQTTSKALEEARRETLEMIRNRPERERELERLKSNLAILEERDRMLTDQVALQPKTASFRMKSDDSRHLALEINDSNWKASLNNQYILCRSDRVIARIELKAQKDQLLLTEIIDWHDPSSTLVKGEKLFILRLL